MKRQGKIKPIICKAAVCLGVVGATLLIISPYSPQNTAETISAAETTSYTTTEQTPLEIGISSLPVCETETAEETSESEQQKPLHYNYTEEEIDMLARLVYTEAGGCSEDEQRLVVWTVFQRVDSTDWDFRNMNDIAMTVTAPNQFAYYPNSPILENIRAICETEISKWANFEKPPTVEPYAPSLPYYFYEGDGYHNWFRAEW
ncbi:MAG: hypothetical protein NC452_04040 [Eubacterium sp.]|nr:hypothetical protein [Eubacterium sp.]